MSQHISYQNALNTSAREKVELYKAAAEERRATFCPFIVTVEGIGHQSMQAFLRHIAAARLSAKWQKPLSTISNWVRVRVQFALIKAVDLRTRGSRKKWRSSGFEDGKGIAVLLQR